MNFPLLFRNFLLFGVALSILACSELDGDDDEDSFVLRSDTADLELRLRPAEVVLGALAFVELEFAQIDFDDFDTQGLSFKFVLPEELEYVGGSALLVLETGAREIEPVFVGAVVPEEDQSIAEFSEDELSIEEERFVFEDGQSFVVFSLNHEDLDGEVFGRLEFSTRTLLETSSSSLVVDLDKGALDIFSPLEPDFDVELQTNFQVFLN